MGIYVPASFTGPKENTVPCAHDGRKSSLYRMEGRWEELLTWIEGLSPSGQPTVANNGEGIKKKVQGNGVTQGRADGVVRLAKSDTLV